MREQISEVHCGLSNHYAIPGLLQKLEQEAASIRRDNRRMRTDHGRRLGDIRLQATTMLIAELDRRLDRNIDYISFADFDKLRAASDEWCRLSQELVVKERRARLAAKRLAAANAEIASTRHQFEQGRVAGLCEARHILTGDADAPPAAAPAPSTNSKMADALTTLVARGRGDTD